MRKPQKVVVGVIGVLGRILICTVFLAAALGYTAADANSLAQTIAMKTTLAPTWVLVGAILLLVLGSLSVVVGYKARFGASALLAVPGADNLLLPRVHVLERSESPRSA